MEYDPYAAPQTNIQPTGQPGNTGISPGVIQALARTKPWVRFISVMMFIGAAFMLLAGVMMFAMGSKLAEMTKSSMYGGGMGAFMAAIYAVLAFIYIYPALKLWKYATFIGSLMSSGSTQDLEMALNEQRSFWKFFGVICLIFVSIYAVIIVIGLIAAMVAAMGAKH